jgi:hypothetical protein
MPQPRRQPRPASVLDWHPGMPEPEPTMCDFCSEPATRATLTRFPCATVTRRAIMRRRTQELLMEVCSCHTPIATEPGDDIVEQGLYGDWGACPECAELIVADDRDGLARRAAALLVRERPNLADARLPPMTIIDAATGRAHLAPAGNWDALYAASHAAFFLHRIGVAAVADPHRKETP